MTKNLSMLVAAGLLAFALPFAGCGKKEEPASQQPATPPAAEAPPAPETPVAPAAAAPADASKKASGGNAAKGKEFFATSCSACHGAGGKGDGAAAAALNPKPKDLTDKAYLSKLEDNYLHDIITKGGAAVGKSALMPPFGGNLRDQDIRDVIAYIRTLAQ